MGSPVHDVHWPTSMVESFDQSFDMQIREDCSHDTLNTLNSTKISVAHNHKIPKPPPLPNKSRSKSNGALANACWVPKQTKDTWDRVFEQAYGADVHLISDDGSIIAAHLSILMAASPVLGNFLQQLKIKNGMRYAKIPGVPCSALRAFIHFLYSSHYEEEEMKKSVLHLLVMSHYYVVPSLKRVCEQFLERIWLTKENVIDVLQLARSCDCPRLAMVCLHMVVKDFKCISSTEGWKVMTRANPSLEQELIEFVVETDSKREERLKKAEEKRAYLLLHEAMEALLHICKDGCQTIGPHDKVLQGSLVSCRFQACKGLETLIRHFYGCKTRVPGGCVHCKRMWQLLELHSRMCNEPDSCKVPLCRHFKVKMQRQSKKDEAKWKLLVRKVIAIKMELRQPFASPVGG